MSSHDGGRTYGDEVMEVGCGGFTMRGKDLILLLSYYSECEIKAPNLQHGDFQPVSAIEFNPANETVELQTYKTRKVEEP